MHGSELLRLGHHKLELRASQMSPTILRIGHFRFFFYSGDREEPPHVHIERNDQVAKIWLDP